eukprot:GHVT01076003.1.p2 GENE.GHVT01076003.1~~GHVT01076003.1.p2  ORF type:complete len:188 (+),score=31.94 GHVT01076003.1:238-801(+)
MFSAHLFLTHYDGPALLLLLNLLLLLLFLLFLVFFFFISFAALLLCWHRNVSRRCFLIFFYLLCSFSFLFLLLLPVLIPIPSPYSTYSTYSTFSCTSSISSFTFSSSSPSPSPCLVRGIRRHAEVMKKVVATWQQKGMPPRHDLCLFVLLKFISSVIPTIEYDCTMDIDMALHKDPHAANEEQPHLP